MKDIQTKRLILRPVATTDTDAMVAIFSDPLVMASFELPPFNRRQMEKWIQEATDHYKKYGYGLCSVILKF